MKTSHLNESKRHVLRPLVQVKSIGQPSSTRNLVHRAFPSSTKAKPADNRKIKRDVTSKVVSLIVTIVALKNPGQ